MAQSRDTWMAPGHGVPINPTICFRAALLFHPHSSAALGDTETHGRKRRGGRLSPGVGGLTALCPLGSQLWPGQGLAGLGDLRGAGILDEGKGQLPFRDVALGVISRDSPSTPTQPTGIGGHDTRHPLQTSRSLEPPHLQDGDRSRPLLPQLEDGDSPAQVPTRVPTRQVGTAPLSCPFSLVGSRS